MITRISNNIFFTYIFKGAIQSMTNQDRNEKTDRVNMKVYDMPVELKNKYISLAKLEYDNKLWKVLDEAFRKLEEEKTKVEEIDEKTEELQKQILYLKNKIETIEGKELEQDEPEKPKTFGSK